VLSELDQLLAESGPRAVFSALLDSSADSRTETLAALTAGYRRLADSDSPWAATATACRTAADDFPGDIGGALVLLLNYLRLRPGEAMYLSAGMVHAYLRGTGVEVLASSDNVLRCGLTAKNVDVAELMRVADFSEVSDPRSPGRTIGPVGVDYRVPVPDFRLRVLGLTGPGSASDDALVLDAGEPALVLSLGGPAEVADGNERLTLQSGQAAFVSAGPDPVTVRGRVAVASTG
jgi:mannose-6-phosphate isomerase